MIYAHYPSAFGLNTFSIEYLIAFSQLPILGMHQIWEAAAKAVRVHARTIPPAS